MIAPNMGAAVPRSTDTDGLGRGIGSKPKVVMSDCLRYSVLGGRPWHSQEDPTRVLQELSLDTLRTQPYTTFPSNCPSVPDKMPRRCRSPVCYGMWSIPSSMTEGAECQWVFRFSVDFRPLLRGRLSRQTAYWSNNLAPSTKGCNESRMSGPTGSPHLS